jgi:hypothetical protein
VLTLRRLALLAVAGGALLLPRGDSRAQEDPLGTARIEIVAGYETAYGNYCLPVANSGLGRKAAADGNLEWQLASNYSVVPVFVRLSHRQSIAMTGHVEVVSSQPYYLEEAAGMHSMTMRRKYVAPPGVPITISMAPRVAPRAAPGQPVTLEVRIFKEGLRRPFATHQVKATQLEPAHVYSLLITGDEQLTVPLASTVDISRRATLPKFIVENKTPPYMGLLSMNHYLLPVARDTVTELPLAARDFAFVCVNAAAAQSWPPHEQAALVQYALAGGHLCLYNSNRNTKLASLKGLGTQPLGRGYLIAEPGGLDAAQRTMDRWLTGELEEFALWMYGSVDEQRIYFEQGEGRYNLRDLSQIFLDLTELYQGPEPTRMAGYLNPIWLYREACRAGAVEPWDFPEFTVPFKITRPSTLRYERDPVLQNWNFAWLAQQLRDVSIKPLRDQSQPQRSLQRGLVSVVLTVAVTLLAGLWALFTPRRSLAAAGLGLGMALLGCAAWATVRPVAMPEMRLVLVDADVGTAECVERMLSAEAGGTSATTLDTLDLVRFARSDSPGEIDVALSSVSAARAEPDAITKVSSSASFLNVASEGICDPAASRKWPVRLWATEARGETVVHLDTSGLAAGTSAVLVTPDGPEVIPAGQADHTTLLSTRLPQVVPGDERLMAWQARYRRAAQRFGAWQGTPDSLAMLRLAVTDSGLFKTESELTRLGWTGLLQSIGGARAFIGNQCWVYCELGGSEHEARFLRLTLALGEADG